MTAGDSYVELPAFSLLEGEEFMYRRPTDEELQYGLEEGDLEEIGDQERRGYGIFTRSAMECAELDRVDACYYNEPMSSDEDCAMEAERSGFCRIIQPLV